LQLFDGVGKARLGYVALPGRAAEMLLLSERHEVFQLAQEHFLSRQVSGNAQQLSLYTKLLVIAISAVVCGIFFSLVLPMIVIVAIALLAGVLIGCIGIGGGFFVPCLTLAGVRRPQGLGAPLFRLLFSRPAWAWACFVPW